MDGLNNTQVGGPERQATSYRFRATSSSPLLSVRVYIEGPENAGYGAGTGGTWEVSVRPDDGTAAHGPSATVLAAASFRPVTGLPLIAFPSPAALTAGALYHVEFRNVDPDPVANYASVNGVFMYQPTSPRQPGLSDLDWGQPLSSGGGAWADRANTIPVMQLNYADGTSAGLGYMEVWVRSYQAVSGASSVRESFTVSGASRSASSLSVRLMRVSGSSPLTVRLERSDGTLVAQGQVAASAVPVGVPGDHGGTGHASWVTYAFPQAVALASGQSYNVVLSAPADTAYSVFVIRKGVEYHFSPSTYFADGHAQVNTGSGWGPFTQDGGPRLDEADLQFYFR